MATGGWWLREDKQHERQDGDERAEDHPKASLVRPATMRRSPKRSVSASALTLFWISRHCSGVVSVIRAWALRLR